MNWCYKSYGKRMMLLCFSFFHSYFPYYIHLMPVHRTEHWYTNSISISISSPFAPTTQSMFSQFYFRFTAGCHLLTHHCSTNTYISFIHSFVLTNIHRNRTRTLSIVQYIWTAWNSAVAVRMMSDCVGFQWHGVEEKRDKGKDYCSRRR